MELRFRTEVGSRRDAAGFEIFLGFARDIARVAMVQFARDRIEDVADERHRGNGAERIHVSRIDVWLQNHIGLVNCLESADRGPVESDAGSERLFVDLIGRHAGMLPGPRHVGEFEIHHFDAGLFHEFDQRFGRTFPVDAVAVG